ncbi:hypothetical protein PG995_011008 [Apiospora arundinis]
MATEATAGKPVDVSGTDATLTQNLSTEPDSQNGGSSATMSLNGPGPQDGIGNKQITDIVDSSVNSAEVSVSGSDTEASTNKANKSGDDKGNGRASSAPKKPQSFKAVSVNKTFLGPKVAANAASRPESAASSVTVTPTGTPGLSASKLKLVAKNSSNLGGSTKTLTSNGKAGAAPDPATVWNRNRPIPPPDTKKMSDEELMSKYGIHMASRLRPEDEAGGQSNWADIDEDDDSWATPETITWTDGTKSSLAATEEPVRIPSPLKEIPRQEKPKSPAPTMAPPPTNPAPAPVAKASPSIKPGLLASGKGLILKGAPEKPTLVAKSTPRMSELKSPWATLPPVDKASPVVMEIPQHSHAPGRAYPPRDDSMARGMPPPPTKEIAADDFSRSPWKDGGGNRELYNSQSGRYEPVQDRRGSRAEPMRQQPSLLHRSPHHETQGPAEPSAAFQTSRTTGQDAPPYGRRRGSSNVSGGSGSFANRFGRPADAPLQNDMIHHQPAPGPGPGPGPFATGNAPHGQRTHPSPSWQSRPSPVPSHAAPIAVPPAAETVPPAAPAVLVDDVELQKKLMRERRELAIKRRQEEEAREEAAKQERIRLKLEAMGPAPERKSAKKDEPKEIQPRQGSSASHKTDAAPNDGNAPTTETLKPSPTKQGPPDRKASVQVNGIQQASSHPHDREHGPTNRLSGPQSSGTWPETTQPNDRLSSWTGATQAAKNVWGAPGNDRTLGNGTFDADLNHLADSQPTQPASLANRQAPIGPPRSVPQAPQSRVDATTTKLAPIGPPQPRQGHEQSQRPAARSVSQNPWTAASIEEDDRAIRRQANQRMEEQMRDLASRGLTLDDAQPPVKDTWRPVALGEDGKRLTGAAVTKIHGEPANRASWSASAPYHDVPATDYRQHPGPNSMRQPPIGSTGHVAPGPLSQPRAGSRFFPNSAPRDRGDDLSVQSRSKSPTPPPPCMHGHPAYDGDAARPHVALPPARPIVKLPPVSRPSAVAPVPTPIAPPKPASFAAALAVGTGPQRHSSSSVSAQPHRPVQFGTQENWQDKINNLIGRKPVSAARPTVVDSSSKSAFDAHGHYSATVSLPSTSSASSNNSGDSSVTSKGMAEDCFDEQEMGSLPPVHLPKHAPEAMWNPVEPNWQPQPPKFRVEATVADEPRYVYDYVNSKPMIRFKTHGMVEAKFVPAPFSSRTKSNPRRQGIRGGARSSRGGPRGGRETSGDHSTGPASDRPERSERHDRSSNRSRGGFRARSENWTRHSSAAQTA